MSEQPPSRPQPPAGEPPYDATRPMQQDAAGRPTPDAHPDAHPGADPETRADEGQPSSRQRLWARIVAARVLIGVALAALLVGVLGTAGVAALVGDDDGGREGRGHHVHRGDRGDGPGFHRDRGGFGERRGLPPGTVPETSAPTPSLSTTPSPSASSS